MEGPREERASEQDGGDTSQEARFAGAGGGEGQGRAQAKEPGSGGGTNISSGTKGTGQ